MVRRRVPSGRWLLRFGYDGVGFAGWARQPGLPTIEGTLLAVLPRNGIAAGPLGGHLDVASRTDRGVSARANALGLRSELSAEALLQRLNAISPRIWFTAATPIAESFNVRRARGRTYRYFDPRPFRSVAAVRAAAAALEGPIDARSFGRGLDAAVPQRRPIASIRLRPMRGGQVIEVRARSFVWGMVRKIVGALHRFDDGRMTLDELRGAARGERRLTLPLAPPEPLVLWSVDYPVRWEWKWAGPNRYQRRYADTSRQEHRARAAVLNGLRPR